MKRFCLISLAWLMCFVSVDSAEAMPRVRLHKAVSRAMTAALAPRERASGQSPMSGSAASAAKSQDKSLAAASSFAHPGGQESRVRESSSASVSSEPVSPTAVQVEFPPAGASVQGHP